MNQSIAMTKHDGNLWEVALNRPEAMNALDMDLLQGLTKCLIDLSHDDETRGIVITGKGKAFCTGGDMKWCLRPGGEGSDRLYELAAHFHAAMMEIRRIKKPVVAAINGVAFGGGFSLAMACDFRIMESSAVLSVGYCSRGLVPDGGLTFHLPRMVGQARALEMLALDQPISKERALEWGLVTRVVEDGQSVGDGLGMLRQMNGISLHSFGQAKALVNNSFNASLETQLEMERLKLRECGNHRDGQEGMSAFVEKRKPVY